MKTVERQYFKDSLAAVLIFAMTHKILSSFVPNEFASISSLVMSVLSQLHIFGLTNFINIHVCCRKTRDLVILELNSMASFSIIRYAIVNHTKSSLGADVLNESSWIDAEGAWEAGRSCSETSGQSSVLFQSDCCREWEAI
jgi:hypothetical protein